MLLPPIIWVSGGSNETTPYLLNKYITNTWCTIFCERDFNNCEKDEVHVCRDWNYGVRNWILLSCNMGCNMRLIITHLVIKTTRLTICNCLVAMPSVWWLGLHKLTDCPEKNYFWLREVKFSENSHKKSQRWVLYFVFKLEKVDVTRLAVYRLMVHYTRASCYISGNDRPHRRRRWLCIRHLRLCRISLIFLWQWAAQFP